jgi:membrane associated rhomboid family serine protease
MKNGLRNFVSSMPLGTRLFLLAYALGYPLALAGHYTHTFELNDRLPLCPALIWKGQVWRVVSYVFLPGGTVDWVVSLFWLATLLSVLGRNWSARGFWGYCLLAALAGALPVVLLKPGWQGWFAGSSAVTFGLLVAWDRLYRRERLILLGIGEISVRQAAILIAVIDALILLFSCGGWFFMMAMMCGGVAGWVYFVIRHKLLFGKSGQPIESERIARLEL